MHVTSAMANSNWCPNGYYSSGFSYSQAQSECQNSVLPSFEAEYPTNIVTAGCHTFSVVSDSSGTSGFWAIGVHSNNNGLTYPNEESVQWQCPGTLTPNIAKPNGKPTCGTCVGDPVNASTGNLYRREEDFHSGRWLTFDRYYNSAPSAVMGPFGQHWSHSYASHLNYTAGGTSGTGTVTITREDGRVSTYSLLAGGWAGEPDIPDALTEQTNSSGNPIGWTLLRVDTRSTEQFNATGQLANIQTQDGFTTILTYSTSSTPTAVAPGAGYLITVTDASQRSIQLTYKSSGLINQVTAPDGSVYSYAYNGANDLSTVTNPAATAITYLYNESAYSGGATTPGLLTGILDENNVRYMSYSYNAAGQATNNQLAGGVGSYTMTYNSDGSTDVVDPLGTSRHHTFTTILGVPYITGVNGTCESCSTTSAWVYDFNGFLNQTTDFNGNVTTYQHDMDGMELGSVEGYGSATPKEIQTDWNDTLHVPTERRVYNYSYGVVTKTDWIYNTRGQALAQCTDDMSLSAAASYTCSATGTPPAGVRRWTYTYCDTIGSACPLIGLRLSVTGPRTDLTQTAAYSYAANGDLQSVTDALGHTTTYLTYDGAGRVTSLQGANGVTTTLTYTPRGWLATRTVGGAQTTFGYTVYGALQSITDPDGVTTTYGYDSAHRLTDVTDAQGNNLHYTLDAAGDKTAEQVTTASGSVVQSQSRTYNALGQLTTIIDGLNQTVFNASASGSYDANGNLVQSSDALSIQRQQAFDPLNRLVKTIANYNGADTATKNTTTTVGLDALDRLTGVTDPSALVTTSTYDGLNNRTTLKSPDTGTSTDTFNAAGDRLTHTDAKGVVSTSTYDALDRLTSTSYIDTTQNVSYTYDEANAMTGCSASAPVGRLTRVIEGSVTTVFCYDGRGNVIQKTQLTSGGTTITSYCYTAADRLSSVATPDLTAISYTYDSDGRINSVQVTPSGATTAPPAVVSSISYLPFGPISSYTLGNGQTITRTYDANYRLTDLTSPALALHFARDAMGDLTAPGNAPGANPATETYSYDPLYRLTGITDAGTALESYAYNQTGDRLSKTAPGLATGAYLYTTGTHQLAKIGTAVVTNDANGNTTGDAIGGNTYGFSYNARNRLAAVQLNGQTVANYTYNALGERIGKVATTPQAVNELYSYDEAGRLLDEYGTTNRDYVWLGDLPVAVIDNTINGSVTSSTVNYVTADQLGTPRVVTNSAGIVIWQWAYQGNPFGEQQPTSSSGYVLNLRYPGQYYDAETGLMYNGARYYESATGRFPQSDPMGLLGGQISTYAYGNNDPLSNIDPTGLACNGQGCWNTPLEKAYAQAGDWKNYYATASAGDDSYAREGSNVANNIGFLSGVTNYRLASLISDHLPRGKTCAADQAIIDRKMEAIREALVAARVAQLDAASASPANPVMVSAQSIAKFHNDIFQAIGGGTVSSWGIPVFGGDLPGSNALVNWCTAPACHP
jgi:RHS repeat-associated protein